MSKSIGQVEVFEVPSSPAGDILNKNKPLRGMILHLISMN